MAGLKLAQASGKREIQRSDACCGKGVEQTTCSRLSCSCSARVHGVGVVEVVVRMNVRFVEHGAGCADDTGSMDDDLSGQGVVEVRVHDGEGDLLTTA